MGTFLIYFVIIGIIVYLAVRNDPDIKYKK
jgi:uncharacterized protein YqhQ